MQLRSLFHPPFFLLLLLLWDLLLLLLLLLLMCWSAWRHPHTKTHLVPLLTGQAAMHRWPGPVLHLAVCGCHHHRMQMQQAGWVLPAVLLRCWGALPGQNTAQCLCMAEQLS
jgi:hypothetical protein